MLRLPGALVLLPALSAAAQTCPEMMMMGHADAVPLCAVVAQVTAALDKYQAEAGPGKGRSTTQSVKLTFAGS